MTIYSPILRDKQQDEPAAHCDQCDGEMYQGDTLYTWDGLHICGECVKQHVLCLTIQEMAELFGAEPVKVGE